MIKPINKGNGTWLIRVACGYVNGQKQMINRTIHLDPASTERAQLREAERQARLLEAEYDQGKLAASKPITFQQLSERFMENYVERKGLSPRTVVFYRNLLDSRILPALGSKQIKDITPLVIDRFYSSICKETPKGPGKGEKLSGTYVRKYHTLLRHMLERAVQWGLLAVNPASKVVPPAQDTKEYTAYDSLQSLQLLEALNDEPIHWRALVTLALYTQMRRGELIGLDWPDIDLDAQTIYVQRSAVYLPDKGTVLKAPKTKAGRRRLVLSPLAVDVLKDLRKSQTEQRLKLGETWANSGAVSTQWNGERMNVDSPTKWFKRFLERAGLPHMRFHDLRHTGASMLIASGLDIETVKKRLGHAQASTTMDIYGHAFEMYDQRPAQVLEELLTPKKHAKNTL